jgi:hypothetical protein
MLRVMRDETAEPTRRDAMAKAAAPYLHLQLSAIAHRHASADGNWADHKERVHGYPEDD